LSDFRGKRLRTGWFDSLQARLFLAVLVVVVPMLCGLGYYVWYQYRGLMDNSDRAAENLVGTTAAYDRALINDAGDVLRTLADSPILRQQRWGECRGYLKSLLGRLPRYVNLAVIGVQGYQVCSGLADPNPQGSYLGDRDYFRQALRQPDVALGGFIIGRLSKVPTLVLALRVPGESGGDSGVVYGALDLNHLRAGAAMPDMLPGARLWILDRDGHVLQRLPSGISHLGERLNPHPSGVTGLVRGAYADARGDRWVSLSMTAGPHGDPHGLSVLYEIPESVLYAEARRALWVGVLVTALLLCVAALAAWNLMQLAAGRSLQHLREAVRRLAAQDFSGRVADRLQGRDMREIGQQFDDMADALQAYQRSLAQSEQSYRLLFEGSPNPMMILSLDSGRFLAVNDEAMRRYGYDRDQFLNLTLDDLRIEVPDHQPDTAFSYERHRRGDGQPLLVEVRSLSLMFTGQMAHVLVVHDLTEQETLSRGLKERERLISQLMDVTAEAIYGLDATGRCIFANQACSHLLGYDHPDQLVGQHFHSLIHYRHEDGRPYPLEECRMHLALEQGQGIHVDDEVLWRRDGSCFPVEYWSYPIWQDSRLEFCLVTFLDISERRAQQRALAYQAAHDPLTGLLNRGDILRRLQARSEQAPEAHWTLVMSNLDGFKEVNEALGHDAGDRLLQAVAQRLQGMLGPACTLARLGSDEFAFLLDTGDEEQAQEQVRALLDALRDPFALNDLQIRISCSFGLAMHPVHARDPDELIRCADTAMRRAKRDGLGITVFNPQDRASVHDRLLLRGELRTALAQGQFLLHLQPKIFLNGGPDAPGGPMGFEALTRWAHPERGMIPPGRFIPVIEVSDLIHPFTLWVVDQAVACCARLQAVHPGVSMAVNVSARNLLDGHFPGQVGDALRRHGLAPALLELEVTESAIMADPARALETLHALSALGVRLSIDDFGTGYSSFAYLNRLPVNALKIDQSFVAGMAADLDMRAIVRSIIEMSHTLGLMVIAEGIETQETLDLLRGMGCDCGQGYFIGYPGPESSAEDWLRAR
jgi:diguanylate cyclase (GGDEF)-like protein/PAS domain S-box-containing protein